MITADDVIDIAPEFESEDSARITRFIAMAATRVSETAFGKQYNLALRYLTAHLLKMRKLKGASGSVTSEKVGDLARSYQPSSSEAGDGSLSLTGYGREYLEIRKSILVAPLVCT